MKSLISKNERKAPLFWSSCCAQLLSWWKKCKLTLYSHSKYSVNNINAHLLISVVSFSFQACQHPCPEMRNHFVTRPHLCFKLSCLHFIFYCLLVPDSDVPFWSAGPVSSCYPLAYASLCLGLPCQLMFANLVIANRFPEWSIFKHFSPPRASFVCTFASSLRVFCWHFWNTVALLLDLEMCGLFLSSVKVCSLWRCSDFERSPAWSCTSCILHCTAHLVPAATHNRGCWTRWRARHYHSK